MSCANIKTMNKREAFRCLLCYDAPCSKACTEGADPAAFLRSIYFENESRAIRHVKPERCRDCAASCEAACILQGEPPIRIQELVSGLAETCSPVSNSQIDLSIDFCEIKCENPFFLSSSIVASGYDKCAMALRMGWGGIVYKTIGFIALREVSPRFDSVSKSGAGFNGLRNLEQISDKPLEEEIDVLRRLKRDFPSKVIVASVMGRNTDEWTRLAEMVTDAGVDIIECNFSCPHMKGTGLGSDIGCDHNLVESYTRATRRGTQLPILAKMTPNLTNIEPPAISAMQAGASGIAAINTIKSLTGVLGGNQLVSGKTAVSGYSGRAVKPIAQRFIYDLASCPELRGTHLSGMGGIETWRDAAEFIALGCGNVQVTTSVMQFGYRVIDDLIDGFSAFLFESGYKSVTEFLGSALSRLTSTEELDRETVVYPVFGSDGCTGCGRCFISCRDAGHGAVIFDSASRKPRLNAKKCAGCHLCSLVCPSGSIAKSKRSL